MGLVIGIIFGALIVLMLYSCCVMSGRSSRRDEELEELSKKE